MIKKSRRILAIIISFVLFTVSFSSSYAELETSKGHWAQETFKKFQTHGVLEEKYDANLSNPIIISELKEILKNTLGDELDLKLKNENQQIVTRGFLAESIVDILGITADVDQQAIELLESKNIFKGYIDGTLKPDKMATVGEAITVIERTFGSMVLHEEKNALKENALVEGNVLINVKNFIAEDLTINGDLIIAPGIGESDLTLNQVIVTGDVYALGGGSESININNSVLKDLIINKNNSQIRVSLTGNTRMDRVLFNSGGTLENKSSFENSIKDLSVKKGEEKKVIKLSGDFGTLNIHSSVDLSTIGQTTIKKMHVLKGEGSDIFINGPTKVLDLIVDAKANIKGNGTIKSMKVNIDGIQSEITPSKIVSNGHKIKVAKNEKSEKTSSKKESDDNNNDFSDEPDTFEAQSKGQAVTDLTFTQKGNNISDQKLGFYPPEAFEEQPEDFQGWLLVYSKSEFDTVWEEINDLSRETIENYSEIGENQRIYQVTNYEWADGLGNTLRSNQKDIVTGKEFGPGLNHFYVATYTDEGILGLAESDEVINILPSPKDMVLVKDGETINNYRVSFDSYDDDRINKNFFFYSKKGLYAIQDLVKDASMNTVNSWIKENKGVLAENTSGEISFNIDQKTILGETFSEDNYYVYGAAISDDGVLDLSWTKEKIINKAIPSPKIEILNEGHGIVLPAGGSTSSSSTDSESFYEYIRESTGKEVPRIAIFSSSRDNSETAYNHYYFDDPTYGSLENNFDNLGFEPVFIPLSIDNAYFYADNEYYSELIKTCDAVFLQGGDQNKHARALLKGDASDTKMMEAIRYVYDRGGIVSGTSAGMAVMGEFAYGYGIPSVVLQTNETEMYSIEDVPFNGDLFPEIDNNSLAIPGIGLVPNEVLNDTHFDARGRLGRLVVAMRDTNKTVGIGGDEGTGLAIQDNVGTVVGHHGIFIVDASNANYGDGEVFNVTDLTLHYLTNGDKYNFETGEVTPASEKTLLTTNDEALEISHDIYKGDYELTKRLLDFSMNSKESVEHTVKTGNEPFFITRFRKTDATEAYSSENNYLDELLMDYNQSTIINLTIDVVEDDTVDTKPPKITGFSYDLNEKPYTVYFVISDDKSGIDEASVTQETVLLTSDTNSIYSTSPDYDSDYGDIKVSIAEDNYVSGDIITFDGITDLSGNVMMTESWIYEEDTWKKLAEPLDLKGPEIISIDQTSGYTVYLQLKEDKSGIDESTVNQTTVKIKSDVNTIYEESPVYDDAYNDIKVSITEDAYVSSDSIIIEGIKDQEGNTIDPHQWVYDGSDWTKEGLTIETVDEEAPIINEVYLSSKYDDTTYINITDNNGIDKTTVTTASVIFISESNTLYKAPEYDEDYDEIEIRINEINFTTGAAITIDGITDTSNNVVEKQTWTFDGIHWIKE